MSKMMLPLLLGGLVGLAAAQFPPTPEGVKVLKSKFHQNVTISYKEVSCRFGCFSKPA